MKFFPQTYSLKMASSDVMISHSIPQDPDLISVPFQSLTNDWFNLK
jgi:hypothetical protein